VDCHAHVFARGLPLVRGRRYTPEYEATIAAYLEMLDANRVTHGVLIQPSFLGTDNGYLLEALRQQPERLRGVVVLPPETPRRQLRELDRRGVRGIRLNLIGRQPPPLAELVWQRHLAEIAELDWQVEVHTHSASLKKIVQPLLAAGVRVVVDHFGRLDGDGVEGRGFRYLLEAAGTRRLWVKLSASYRLTDGKRQALQAIPLLRGALGLDRLLWGSDWPHTEFERVASPAAAKRELESWFPDPAEREIVLADTPARLFRFPGLISDPISVQPAAGGTARAADGS
jgi:predicted TIM-barrel fold metal-dependent hydrolase